MRFYTLNFFEEGRLVHCRNFRAADDRQAVALADDAVGDHEAELVSGTKILKSYKPR